ncbi:MAG: hypothetical protein ACTSRP_24965, partial [Candidatus Helarchaeota archaeon]
IIDIQLPYICYQTRNATTITGYKKEPVLLGDTLTYQTKINNPLSNEESEDTESAPFKHEYVSSFLIGLSITLTSFAIIFGMWGLIYDKNEGWAIICMVIIVLTAVLLVFGCISPLKSYNKELIEANPLFLIVGILVGIFLAGVMVKYACSEDESKKYYEGLKKAIFSFIVTIIGLIAVIIDINWIKSTVIESIIAFIILVYIPFVLAMRAIYKTVSNTDKIEVVANILAILGFIGVIIAIIWIGFINETILFCNLIYYLFIIILLIHTLGFIIA